MKKMIFLFIISCLFLTCKQEKDDDNNNPPPPPDDTSTFTVPSTRDIVMYEVNLRALSTTGDIQGVIARLGEIKSLGINVIWLMPIHPIGEVNSVNSPYSVKDYKGVNPEFGTLNDLKTLVSEAHKKGIAVIIDWVANHTAWDNPWIVNKDWYTQDGQGNIVHPPGTNWQDVADLDYSNFEMRQAMIEAMEFWIVQADVDGFRCDAADMVPVDFWQDAIAAVDASTERELVWLAEGGNSNLFDAGFQMNYAWNYYSKLKDVFGKNHSANTLVMVHNSEYAAIPEGKLKLRFTTNHDESAWDATPMVLFGGADGSLAAFIAAICIGGVPLVYGSQEVGTENNVPFFSNQPINWSSHPEMLHAYRMILSFYNRSEALRSGEMESHSTADVLAFSRTGAQEEVLVIDNIRDRLVSFDIPSELEQTVWKDVLKDSTDVILEDKLELEAFQYVVLQRFNPDAHVKIVIDQVIPQVIEE